MSGSPASPADPQESELAALVDQIARDLHYGRLQQAEGAVQRLLEMRPGSTTAHELHGDLLLAQDRAAEAREAYKRAVELEPANADAERKYAQLALQLSQSDRMRAAIMSGDLEHFRGATHKNPTGAVLRSLVFPGLGHLYNGDYETGVALAAVGFVLLLGFMLLFAAPLVRQIGPAAGPGPSIWGWLSFAALLITYLVGAYHAYRSALGDK